MGEKLGEKRVGRHLYLRHNRYYAVWKPPAEFRHLFRNVKQIKVALGSDLYSARLKAEHLVAGWKLEVEAERKRLERSPDAAAHALEIVHTRHHDESSRLAIRVAGKDAELWAPLTDESTREEHLEVWFSRREVFDDLRTNTDGETLHLLIDSAIHALKKSKVIPVNEHDVHMYHQTGHDFNNCISLMYVAQEFSDYDVSFENELRNSPNATTLKKLSGITTAMIERWHAHQITQHKKAKTAADYAARVTKFHKYLLQSGQIVGFESVSQFIKNCSPKRATQNGYLTAIKAFWKWATTYETDFKSLYKTHPDPTIGHILPKNVEASKEEYATLKLPDVQKLFKSCLQPEHGKQDLELATLISIGYYTGARLEEIGSLCPEVYSVNREGIAYFKVVDAKTPAGIREIPIHPELHKLIHTLNQISNSTSYLSNKVTKRGTKVDHLSKRFGRLKSSLGYPKKVVFHSLRKTFVTELLDRQAPDHIVQKIVGHAGKTITTSVYYQASALQHTMPVIKMLPTAIELEPLVQAISAGKSWHKP